MALWQPGLMRPSLQIDERKWVEDMDCIMERPSNSNVTGLIKSQHKARLKGFSIMVLGHRLGAALSTYLSYFETHVKNYGVSNYQRDLVPKLPIYDVFHFTHYESLH